jgi:predicted signal transduction protein with EAL and GGDEF domain
VNASHYDYLTGLPNMSYFFELAETGKDAILREGDEPMLLYIDLNGMKFFNTNFGFAEGDKMLQSLAKLLSSTFGSENCCRIGGDHYAVVARDKGLEDNLNDIFQVFGGLYKGKTPPIHVGIYPRKVEDVPSSTACDRAKFACKSITGSYSSCFNYYSAQLRDDALLRQYIVENIDTAIEEQWIQVYLQPIIRAVNEDVCDVEALARWIDPERGTLSPASFIPALEDAGLIYKLDLYMVDKVLESINEQKADGMYVVPHSINLSRSDFDACDIVEEIRSRVDKAGVRRDILTIEITESTVGKDFEFMKKQVERFQMLGFPVWMDDFGSGYSSLDVLQSIKFDLL